MFIINLKGLLFASCFGILFFCFSNAYAQVVSNQGKEFWVAFPTHVPDFDKQLNMLPAQMSIFITGGNASSGQVTAGSFSTHFVVAANKVTEVQVPRNAAYINDNESGRVLPNRAIHITVDDGKPNVAVYSHIFAGQRSAASLVLPVKSLGNRYFSMNYQQHDTEGYNYIAIIASEPQTTIHLWRGTTELVPGGITLNNVGDVYQYLSADDLTGVGVAIDEVNSPCKHFAMYSGSSGVYIPTANCTAKSLDPLFQQCYPVDNWGKQYGYIPFSTRSTQFAAPVRTDGQYIRVLAGDKPSDIKIDDVPVATLQPGTYYTTPDPLPYPAVISASEPVMVAQFALSQSCSNTSGNGLGFSDPDMVVLNPVNYSIADITVYSSTRENISEQYLNILIPSAGSNSFRVNGQLAGAFLPMPKQKEYSYLQLDLKKFNSDNLHLTADVGFNAIAYGFGNVESYAYSAGTNLAANQSLSVIKTSTNIAIDSACINDDFFFKLTLPYRAPKITWKMDKTEEAIIQLNPTAKPVTISGRNAYTYQLAKTSAYTTPGNHQYFITADYPATTVNCGDGAQIVTGSFKTAPLPVASFNLKPDLCGYNAAFEYIGDKTDSPVNFLWNFGDLKSRNNNTSTLENPMHIFSGSGTYTISVTVKNYAGCETTVSKQLILNSKVIPLFHTSPNTCQDEQILFTDDSQNTPNFTIKSRTWDFGDGESANATSVTISHSYKTPGDYKIRLILESITGCLSEPIEHPVTIVSKSTPDFKLPEICVTDGKAIFQNRSINGIGANVGLTYIWQFGDDKATPANPNTSTEVNPVHIYTEAKTYTVTLTATNSNGCQSTITKSLIVNDQPHAAFNILTAAPFCSGHEINLLDQSFTPNGTITRLVWYFNADEDLSDKTEIDHPAQGQTYTHTYAPVYGPETSVKKRIRLVSYSGQSCYSEVSQTITLFTIPKLQFDSLPDICDNEQPIQITQAKEISGINNGNSFFTGEGVSKRGSFDPVAAGAGKHNITFNFLNAAGCAETISQQINVITTPKVTMNAGILILKGDKTSLKPIYHGENLRYKWTPATGLDNDAVPYPLANPAVSTVYRVEISNGVCSEFALTNITVLLPPVIYNTFTPNGDGVNDLWEIPNLVDYPNATVSIFNRYGMQIYSCAGYLHPWNGQYNGKPIPAGTYYYVIKPGNGQKVYSGPLTVIR